MLKLYHILLGFCLFLTLMFLFDEYFIYINMNEEFVSRLKKLEIEEIIWLVLIIIILLSFIANQLERDFLIYNREESKKRYRELMIIIFASALITYSYYFLDSIKDLQSLKDTDSQKRKEQVYLSFLSSLFIVIAGIILLYIAYTDQDIETELAFN